MQAATNTSAAFTRFVPWRFFGGEGMSTSTARAKQRKRIKSNHRIAHGVILHHVPAQTRMLPHVARAGHAVEAEV